MKKHRIKITILLIVLIAYAAFSGWDYYMRIAWDDHIVTERPEYFILFKQPDYKSYKILNADEIKKLPQKYKEKLEIIESEGKGILKGHNDSFLDRTTSVYNPEKNGWYTEQIEKNRKSLVFKNDDGSIKIIIAVDSYIHYGCHPLSKEGNATISYILDDGDKLTAYTNTRVYENFIQYVLCK